MNQPRHNSTTGNATNSITQNGASNLTLLCAQVHAQVQAFVIAEASSDLLRAVQKQSQLTLKILDEALDRYGYVSRVVTDKVPLTIQCSLEELSLSYNGGKDCLVLLILYLASLHTYSKKSGISLPDRLHTVYIVSSHPFEEVEDFVESSISTYHLELVRYAKPMKEAFEDYLKDRKQVKAIFVGTRRTDPHGGSLKYFDPTDGGWPSFMRIHPVIDWHYAEIWSVSDVCATDVAVLTTSSLFAI